MVVKYTESLAGKRLDPVDGQPTPSAVSLACSDWENVGRGHLSTDEVTHDGECSDSARDRRIMRLPVRTNVDCWLCVMRGDEVGIVVTAERLFAPADISSVPVVACLARNVPLGRREPKNTSRLQQDEAARLRDGFPAPIAHRDASEQGIEDCVHQQVQAWDNTRPVEMLLTSGYGHPPPWVLHESNPATAELLQQYQIPSRCPN